MEIVITHLYCFEFSLQFDAKYVFDFHLLVVHGEKIDVKVEVDSQTLDDCESQELKIEHQDEKNISKNESKIRKLPTIKASL